MLSGELCATGGAIMGVGRLRVEMMGICSSMFEGLVSTALAGKEGDAIGGSGPDGDLTISPQSSSSSSRLALRVGSLVSNLLSPGGSMSCSFSRLSPDARTTFFSLWILAIGSGDCAVAEPEVCTTFRCVPTPACDSGVVGVARAPSTSPKLATIPLIGEVLQPNCATGVGLL